MKLSVSLSEEDVALLDEHGRRLGLRSRSAAVQQAIRLLRHADLERDYAAAWADWEATGEPDVWDDVTADGLS